MNQYEELLKHVYSTGAEKSDRTGTGTRSVFGAQIRFDLSKGFPLITSKKVHLKSIIHELLWFIKGDTNNQHLQDQKSVFGTRMRHANFWMNKAYFIIKKMI